MKLPTSLVLGTCALLVAAAPASAATKINLMFTGFSGFAGAFIAKDQGFFENRGLDVDLTLALGGSISITALVAGATQIGGTTPTVLLQAVENSIDLVVIGGTSVLSSKDRGGVVARTGSDIKEAKDLVGKKVGVPGFGALIDVMLRKWLIDQGIDVRNVNFVEVSFPQMADTLKGRQVDAVATADPFFTRIISADIDYFVANYGDSLPDGTITGIYAAMRPWVAANPDAVKAFRESLEEALAFAKENPEKVRESIGRHLKLPPQVVATQSVPSLVAKVIGADMQLWVDIAVKQKLINGPIDPNKVVTPWQ
jgi:NitT/TauT family transport system substrate-binding protein